MVANAGRYVKMFCEAVDASLPQPTVDIEQVQAIQGAWVEGLVVNDPESRTHGPCKAFPSFSSAC